VAAVTEVRVPDLGEFADVPVIEVLVAAGDTVAPEDPLIVLESEKATMEVPAPVAGVVERIAVKVDDEVSEGDLILTLAEVGAEGSGAPEGEGAPGAAADDGAAGESPAAEDAPPVEEDEDEEEKEERGAAEPPSGEGEEPADEEPSPDGRPEEPYAGPGARRLARELGVDLSQVRGSGQKGRITKDDVTAQAGAGDRPAKPAAGKPAPAKPAPELPPWPTVDFARFGPIETVELSRIKRIAGPKLARNWVMIPHVTQHDEADITELEKFRVEVNAAHEGEGVKVTMVALLLKASAAALRAFPEVNSSLDGDRLVLKRYYHLGFAADTPLGLMVPVVKDVDRKGILEIARELAELSGAAREGKLAPGDMQGGTFTISSLGGIGGTAFTPIINAPEVAVLGVSRSAMKPVWIEGEFRPRLILPLSFSYDHRVIDGAAAARFTTHLAGLLGDPLKMLL